MKTSEFLDILKTYQGKSLLFQYQPDQFVKANYHITEVKNISVESVDCGAGTDAWNETIVQLWESPSEIGKTEFMSSYKALSILTKVDRMRAMDRDAEIKVEYSNDSFHTAQLFVNDYEINPQQLIFNLAVEKTDCKAKETCGVPAASEAKEVESCCSPQSGCC